MVSCRNPRLVALEVYAEFVADREHGVTTFHGVLYRIVRKRSDAKAADQNCNHADAQQNTCN